MRVLTIAVHAIGMYGAVVMSPLSAVTRPTIIVQRLPSGGIQPQAAVDTHGAVHIIFFRGESARGDAFHIQSLNGGLTFSTPVQINSTPGSVIAVGTVRGAQLAIGLNGRVHVAWVGSRLAMPGATPMFYTRLNDDGTAFEPQRNVTHDTYNIDGGGAVAAADDGHVYIVWHANAPGEHGEGTRRVWITRSSDDGGTFERERPVSDESTGACGCCGLAAFSVEDGALFVLFRSAFNVVHRDMYLLTSHNFGGSFTNTRIDQWTVGACVMSTQAFAKGPSGVYTAWETEGQVFMGRINAATGTIAQVIAAPGPDRTRKHPALAVNAGGDVLLAWTEGTGWNKGGAAGWQVFDAHGMPIGEPGHADGVPLWGSVAAYAPAGDRFTVAY